MFFFISENFINVHIYVRFSPRFKNGQSAAGRKVALYEFLICRFAFFRTHFIFLIGFLLYKDRERIFCMRVDKCSNFFHEGWGPRSALFCKPKGRQCPALF